MQTDVIQYGLIAVVVLETDIFKLNLTPDTINTMGSLILFFVRVDDNENAFGFLVLPP